MGVLITIPVRYMERGNSYEFVHGNIRVILIDDRALDFPDYDIEADLIAEDMGFEPETNLYNTFYREYTRGVESYQAPPEDADRGFAMVLDKHPLILMEALERQGYESFNDGDYSRRDFALLLSSLLKKQHRAAQLDREKIQVLQALRDKDALSQKEYIDLLLHQLEQNRGKTPLILDELLDYSELVDPDEAHDRLGYTFAEHFETAVKKALAQQIVSSTKHSDAVDLLQVLLSLGYSKDDFELRDSGAYSTESYEASREEVISDRVLLFDGEEFAEWPRRGEFRIYDHIGFAYEFNDFIEYDAEFGTPSGAKAVLDELGFEDPDFDEEELDPPRVPQSDKDGEYGVLYEGGDYEEKQLVPYGTHYDAVEAKELSESILDDMGESEDWEVTIMRRATPEDDAEDVVVEDDVEWVADEDQS